MMLNMMLKWSLTIHYQQNSTDITWLKKRKDCQFFSNWKFCWCATFTSHSLFNILYDMFVYIIFISLGHLRMGSIRNNSVRKKKIPTEKIFSRQFSVALINSILTLFIITMKKLTNWKMKLKRKKYVRPVI